jgi:hypothetical protein
LKHPGVFSIRRIWLSHTYLMPVTILTAMHYKNIEKLVSGNFSEKKVTIGVSNIQKNLENYVL